jgi:digalactosyldiacylglycerol synthase
MGKWVVCAKHPSNQFFEQFPNCLLFRTQAEFIANIYWALHHDPAPLTAEQRYALSWEAATERFIRASAMTYDMYLKSNKFSDKFSLWVHDTISSGTHGDLIRGISGEYYQIRFFLLFNS